MLSQFSFHPGCRMLTVVVTVVIVIYNRYILHYYIT